MTFGQDSFEIPESGVFDIVETCDLSNGFEINLRSKYEQTLMRDYEKDLDYEMGDIYRGHIETQ